MTHTRSINLISRGKVLSAPIPKPAKADPIQIEIDVVLLENPKAEDIKPYRSQGWRVAFESFTPLWTPNGIRTHHFMRLEKGITATSLHQ